MGKIYKNQTNIRLIVTTGVDITDAQATKIKYQKPDGTTGQFDATPSDDTKGIIYYDLGSALNIIGRYTFWAYITFSDGSSAPGQPFDVIVREEGS